MPEIDLADVDVATSLVGKRLQAPLLISCMTGGTPRAGEINRVLARAAQRHGLAIGLGSARALIEKPELLETFAVRDVAPTALLLANVGAVQLNLGYSVDDCRRLVDMLQADALAIHLNALQEAVQPEGDTQFRGLRKKIEKLCRKIGVPVIAKEVGWGIDVASARVLLDAGVAAIDVAGAGGTSWSEVERFRAADDAAGELAAAFDGWGIPTAHAVSDLRKAFPRAQIVASGGIRTGIDAVKALALGADAVGLASPFLHAAAEGSDAADALAAHLIAVIRTAMFAMGQASIRSLQRAGNIERARDR